jgi:LmbE family N-acetylglucosaminyl deacetylase
MLKFQFAKEKDRPLKILCLGAHSDDIEIGCGGSILRLLEKERNIEIHWVVFSSNEERANEARNSAELFLLKAKYKNIIIKNYRDAFFPYIGGEIKSYFEELKQSVDPDLIFSHYRHDLHQDHRIISELTWNTFRNHFILEYEIIKYDGDLGNPNFFIQLNKKICQTKIENIFQCFETQGKRSWFTEDAFHSIMRIRGVESNAPEKYAEAFYCRKMVF